MTAATLDAAVSIALDEESRRRGKRLTNALMWAAGAIAVLWFTGAQIGMSPLALVKGIPFMADFFSRMFPPNLGHLSLLGEATLETATLLDRPAKTRFDRRRRDVDVMAVEAETRLQPKAVARAEPDRLDIRV